MQLVIADRCWSIMCVFNLCLRLQVDDVCFVSYCRFSLSQTKNISITGIVLWNSIFSRAHRWIGHFLPEDPKCIGWNKLNPCFFILLVLRLVFAYFKIANYAGYRDKQQTIKWPAEHTPPYFIVIFPKSRPSIAIRFCNDLDDFRCW